MAVLRIGTPGQRGWRGCGWCSTPPSKTRTCRFVSEAASACSSAALRRLCPPRGDRSQVARCSRRLPAAACQVWQRPGRATLPACPELGLLSRAPRSVPAAGLRALPRCSSPETPRCPYSPAEIIGGGQVFQGGSRGRWVSVTHLRGLCPSRGTGGGKQGALLGAAEVGMCRGLAAAPRALVGQLFLPEDALPL